MGRTVEEARRRALGFDRARVGELEARGWQAYYAKRWPRMALLLYRLVRSQLGLSSVASIRAVRHGAKAAIAFAPVANDPETARAELHCFYEIARAATGLPFDAAAAGDAEFDFWVVHRRLAGQEAREPLVEALARIPAVVYGVPADVLRESATEREQAVRMVDRITAGVDAPTDELWHAIAQTLGRSHGLLRDAVAVAWSTLPAAPDEPASPTRGEPLGVSEPAASDRLG